MIRNLVRCARNAAFRLAFYLEDLVRRPDVNKYGQCSAKDCPNPAFWINLVMSPTGQRKEPVCVLHTCRGIT